jgi:hypothetical protein
MINYPVKKGNGFLNCSKKINFTIHIMAPCIFYSIMRTIILTGLNLVEGGNIVESHEAILNKGEWLFC